MLLRHSCLNHIVPSGPLAVFYEITDVLYLQGAIYYCFYQQGTIWSKTSLPVLSFEVSIIFPEIFILFPNNGLCTLLFVPWIFLGLKKTLPLHRSLASHYLCRSIAPGAECVELFNISLILVNARKFTIIPLSSIPSITLCFPPPSLAQSHTPACPAHPNCLVVCKQFLGNGLQRKAVFPQSGLVTLKQHQQHNQTLELVIKKT